MARIVILGAGVSGVAMAMELEKSTREGEEIILVSDSPAFNFNPSNLWVAINASTPRSASIELPLLLSRHAISFIQGHAVRVHPSENRVELESGDSVPYDLLVIATGPRPAFEEVPGLGPQAHTQSICRVDEASAAGTFWDGFVQNPGPIVVGAVQGASYFAAAYEYALIIDADLRRRKIRERAPITFVTAEPFIGHLGRDGIGDTRYILESEFRAHGIPWITNARVDRIGMDRMHVTEMDADGREKQKRELPFKHCMMMPALTGVDALQGIEGLVDGRGFVLVDERQRNPNFRNIYAVGTCVAIPMRQSTPVPISAAKNGYMMESMVLAAAGNIRAQLDGLEPVDKADWEAEPQVYAGDAFDQKWVNPVAGLYALPLWECLSDMVESP
jgi:sulfide:quinone oxidoreductase